MKRNKDKHIDREWVHPNSLDSPLDIKRGELAKPELSKSLRLPDGRLLDWKWCMDTWDKIGRPVIHAGDNDNIFDLSLFLYAEKLSPKRLEGIVIWLEEHSGEMMMPLCS
jgi:hypothetical protein